MVNSRTVGKGVISARLLIAQDTAELSVPVVNMSEKACIFKAGQFLTQASPLTTKDTVMKGLPEVSTDIKGAAPTPVEDHITSVIANFPPELTADQKAQAVAFVRSYTDLFSRDNGI